MELSSKAGCSRVSIQILVSKISSPLRPNRSLTAKRRCLTKSYWMESKKRLEEAKGKWVEELPSVMWTHRTTARRSTGETPFPLAYGFKAVIPLEIGLPTTRTIDFDPIINQDNLRKDLDLLEGKCDMVAIRLASYQQHMKRGHDKNIRLRHFQIGDLVLRKVVNNTRIATDGKLGPN